MSLPDFGVIAGRLLLFRDVRDASLVFAAAFAEAETEMLRAKPTAKPEALEMSYPELTNWVQAIDKASSGAKLKANADPDHLMRQWMRKACADGIVESRRPGFYALGAKGRRLAGFLGLTSP